MKKISLFITFMLGLSLIMTACGENTGLDASSLNTSSTQTSAQSSQPAVKTKINVGAVKGPSGIGMAYLMEQNSKNETENDYNFLVAGAQDEITAKVLSGEVDIAAVAPNAASVLYNKTNKEISVITLSTLGMLYIVSNDDSIKTVEDLKGKNVTTAGQGAVPEYAFNFILDKNGVNPADDINIEWNTEHSETAAKILAGSADAALLPEPFVTQVTSQDSEIKIALDLTAEWTKASDDGSKLTMGCVIVRNEFLNSNKEAVNLFLEEYKASIAYTDTNTEDAAVLCEKYDIIKEAVAKKAIPNCNITYIDGNEMQDIMGGFLTVLFNAEPKSVGGALPDENFYYKK